MTVTQISNWWDSAYNGGGSGQSFTWQINIVPAQVMVSTWLYGTSPPGGGYQLAGISHYRRRLPSGKDKDIDVGGWATIPPSLYDYISEVTLELQLGAQNQGWAFLRMDHWG